MKTGWSVLLVEDDEVDVMTIRRAWRDLAIGSRLAVAGDGLEALDYLAQSADDLPSLILLDLNMPRMNGLEFLRIVKTNPQLRHIPVVVFTASKEESDRVETFGLGIAGYMVKPPSYAQLKEIIRSINDYWRHSEQPRQTLPGAPS
jgi:CheY-like chemotaxis protein